MLNAMSNVKCKTLDDINDLLIVHKITERDPDSLTSKEILEEETYFRSDFDKEKYLLAEEQEAIVRKQLQLLQADERGRQALISEIAAIKQRQEKRAELLRIRQHALDIERERARKIASLPPPLPKSVKVLLRKCDDEPKISKPDVQMPDELKAVRIKAAEPCNEDKENIVDLVELEARQKMQEEWQVKAKKRFNEALKKDRQKEEYSKIMKQIQNAELLSRREMAKNISSDRKCIPCPLSDKFETAKKQSDMEDAAEKVFKKINRKEHVIEDIEGYQDYYENKYKKIDSDYESKMIDCVPDFVKENYEYLLEDESKFQGGKHFSGLDDSASDILNQAYIETPPDLDTLDGREKIDLAINHLDKLRSDLQTEYDQTLKPLLVAAIEVPKKQLSDKAVEAVLLKLPIEDKAVETDIPFSYEFTSPPSPPHTTDLQSAGIMAFKRRHHGPILNSFRRMNVPDMHRRDVYYSVPSVTQSEIIAPGSWSSSSYCSLPSQHGISSFPSASESVKCDICVAEMSKDFVKDTLPQEVPQGTACFTKGKSDKSTTSTEKAPLSEYVQQLAKKYLVAKSTSSSQTAKEAPTMSLSDSYLPIYSNTETVSPAFEREKISKPKTDLFVEHQKLESFLTSKDNINMPYSSSLDIGKPDIVTKTKPMITVPDSIEVFVKNGKIFKDTLQEKLQDDIYEKMRSTESPKSPIEPSEYDMEAKRIQLIHQVLARRLPRFTLEQSPKPIKVQDSVATSEDEKESEHLSLPISSGMVVKPHIYHELSTIQEMDSALTAGSLQLSQSKLSDTSLIKAEKEIIPKEQSKYVEQSEERLKMASLLDPPDTSIAELAKSIHFVAETEGEAVQPLEVPKIISSESLDVVSVTSKDSSLIPSSLISSLDSNSCYSVSSNGKVFSSSLTENHIKYPHLRDTKILPQYFVDVSEIQKQLSSSEKYALTSSVQVSEFLSSDFSSPISPSQSISSVINSKSKEKKDNMNSLISEYITSPVPSSSKFVSSVVDAKCKDKKDTMDSLISGYITSPLSNSNRSIPSVNDAKLEEKKDADALISGYITSPLSNSNRSIPSVNDTKLEEKKNADALISGFISNIGTSDVSSSGTFRPMTPHSDISSPSMKSDASKLISDVSEKNDFVSSRPLKYGPFLKQYSSSDSSGSFKPMTPHSDISFPSGAFTSKSDYHGYASSTESFKPMTPHSDISSPGEVFTPKVGYHGYASNIGSFKPLTPKSMISSSSLLFDDAGLKDKNVSSGNSEFYPMTVRFDISSNSVSSDSTNNQSNVLKKLPQLNYHITLKTNIPESLQKLQPSKVSRQNMISAASDNERKIYYVTKSQDAVDIKRKCHEVVAETNASTCSSDFFVPKFTAADLPSSETKNNECCLVEGTLLSEELHENDSKPKSSLASQEAAVLSRSSQHEENLPKTKNAGTESTSSCEEILVKNIEEKAVTGEKPKESNIKEDLDDLKVAKGFNKPYSSLYAISSTSSSTENLSEISGSKVLYQSTPIKSIEEIAQERGILEEPDLTLITTEYSCRVDSPENPRKPSNASTATHSINQEKDCTLISSQNECKTPANESPQLLGCADTPSMISFLHHEMSCMQNDEDAVRMAAEDPNLASDVSERRKNTKDNQRSRFPRTEYKQRTKRLWNNLEEVKKKNSAEERKKLMAVNRLKAKEYAKKLTPKKKI